MKVIPEEVKLFLIEAYENLETVENLLLEFEKHPEQGQILHTLFRSIHTIKGNSAFLGLNHIELLCHRGETVLDALRAGRLGMSDPLVSTLLALVDATRAMLQAVEASGDDEGIPTQHVIEELGTFLS